MVYILQGGISRGGFLGEVWGSPPPTSEILMVHPSDCNDKGMRTVFSFFMIYIFRRMPSLQSTKPNSRGNTSKTTVHQLTNRVYQSSFATDQPPVVLNQLSSKIHQPVLEMHQISAGICKSTAEIRPSFAGSSTCSFIPLEPGSETKWNQSEDEFFEHDELDYLVSTKLKCI